ncbi:hypothetical protein [Lentilactobacillus parabuchneri]|uniref:hypothetical protein n=1 Tax=Lentilactobacillus parabuchneri TaxID=152331 RepID=UPI000A10A29C|nr:hypothetical protein [Lentilactobacillus parabuchneri]ORN13314.1 hypothetical protein FAM23164_02201 [Lentilactobacillus parabuchneri]ORN14969.1 hypothetical protein FAM23165_02325 [Lentilactobacillus parabuchneri]ORN18735.1 hypothetical protein FAM23166_01994 [Lentilactobacillus parabuchneri]ORN23937.1 hypothetical protein FAM23167_02151 [Lentilactobacillus parabuchneri]
MEFLTELLVVIVTFSFFLGLISLFVLATVLQRKKNNANFQTKHNWKKITQYLWLTFIVSTVLFSFTSANTPDAKKEAAQESSVSAKKASSRKVKKQKQASSSSRKKTAKASSIKANKDEKKLEKKTRAKNIKRNFVAYKADLAKLPTKTKNAITHAYYSKTSGGSVIVINDEVLNASDSAVRSTVHNAWKIGQNVFNNNSPLPDSVNYLVTVQDEGGDQLAHTSMFGSFKYDGQ